MNFILDKRSPVKLLPELKLFNSMQTIQLKTEYSDISDNRAGFVDKFMTLIEVD